MEPGSIKRGTLTSLGNLQAKKKKKIRYDLSQIISVIVFLYFRSDCICLHITISTRK